MASTSAACAPRALPVVDFAAAGRLCSVPGDPLQAPYGFGLSQEDERTDAAALQLRAGDRVVCIASAGEMPLSLLALGAGEVVAVDSNPHQLHLVALKLAAIRALPVEEALRFLGFLPARGRERRRAFERVAPLLPDDAARFWAARGGDVAAGAIWRGGYERYVRLLRLLAGPILGRRHVEALFEGGGLEAQRERFERGLGRGAIQALFRIAFHPRVYARRGMDPRSLAQRRSSGSLGAHWFGRFRTFCTGTPARANPFLQLTLLGRLVDSAAAPTCFTEAGAAAVRARHERLRLRRGDVLEVLRGEPAGRFDAAQLSNLADWLPPERFDALLREVARVVHRGRAVWRALHVDRAVPPDLAGVVRADEALGAQLLGTDRFPFYRVVPVSIGAARAR